MTQNKNLDTLAKLTGVDKQGILSIMEQVKVNKALIESCPKHDFQQIQPSFGSKYRCKYCKGTADASAVYWYEQGLRHKNGV